MKRSSIFYLVFILTILAIRLGVFLFPQKKLIVDGAIIHHFWVGIILALFALLLPKKYTRLRIGLFSIGLGLTADELVYMTLGDGTVSHYWSIYSLYGVIAVAIIIFAVRKKIAIKF